MNSSQICPTRDVVFLVWQIRDPTQTNHSCKQSLAFLCFTVSLWTLCLTLLRRKMTFYELLFKVQSSEIFCRMLHIAIRATAALSQSKSKVKHSKKTCRFIISALICLFGCYDLKFLFVSVSVPPQCNPYKIIHHISSVCLNLAPY